MMYLQTSPHAANFFQHILEQDGMLRYIEAGFNLFDFPLIGWLSEQTPIYCAVDWENKMVFPHEPDEAAQILWQQVILN
jgi:hypothetical protein